MKSFKEYIARLLIKLNHWEFWPTALVYLPILICYPYWVLRTRSLFFFQAVNPRLRMGGLYGASKYQSLTYLKAEDKPKTLLFTKNEQYESVEQLFLKAGISYPIIIKPDIGERGKGIEKIDQTERLKPAVESQTSDYLVQEYLDMPFEAGVFYIKHPTQLLGKVTSIVVKGFLEIEGDGESTIKALAAKNKRAVLIWSKLKMGLSTPETYIPNLGEKIVLEHIGNHSRGTAFNDGNHLINQVLTDWAESVASQIPEFYYGRFDVRARSIEDFLRGETIKIMEVNGANAEPAHIYQEGASLTKGMKTLMHYWHTLYLISKYNLKTHPKVKFAEAWHAYKCWQEIKREKWSAYQQTL
jgi:hypothetical protein